MEPEGESAPKPDPLKSKGPPPGGPLESRRAPPPDRPGTPAAGGHGIREALILLALALGAYHHGRPMLAPSAGRAPITAAVVPSAARILQSPAPSWQGAGTPAPLSPRMLAAAPAQDAPLEAAPPLLPLEASPEGPAPAPAPAQAPAGWGDWFKEYQEKRTVSMRQAWANWDEKVRPGPGEDMVLFIYNTPEEEISVLGRGVNVLVDGRPYFARFQPSVRGGRAVRVAIPFPDDGRRHEIVGLPLYDIGGGQTLQVREVFIRHENGEGTYSAESGVDRVEVPPGAETRLKLKD